MRRFVLSIALITAAGVAAPATPAPGSQVPTCPTFAGQGAEGRAVRARDVELRLSAEWADENRVTWILRLQNRTNDPLRLTFPSSSYANVAVRRSGANVYSWRRGDLPAFWSMTLPPRESLVCSLSPDVLDISRLEPGRYVVVASLNLYPFDVRVKAQRPLTLNVM